MGRQELQAGVAAAMPEVVQPQLITARDPRLSPALQLGLLFAGLLALDPVTGACLVASNGRSRSGRAPRYVLVIPAGESADYKRFRADTDAAALEIAQGKLVKACP